MIASGIASCEPFSTLFRLPHSRYATGIAGKQGVLLAVFLHFPDTLHFVWFSKQVLQFAWGEKAK